MEHASFAKTGSGQTSETIIGFKEGAVSFRAGGVVTDDDGVAEEIDPTPILLFGACETPPRPSFWCLQQSVRQDRLWTTVREKQQK
jgi:hypothetical protein